MFKSLCLSVLIAVMALAQSSVATPSTTLTVVNYADLISNDKELTLSLATSLVTIGAIQIKGIPSFREVRDLALQSFSECMATKTDKVLSKTMTDGSLRLTAQAASKNGLGGAMSDECADASSKLRSVVDATMRQLFLAMDSTISSNSGGNSHEASGMTPVMAPYGSYSDLMRHGLHLEHMHAYYGPATDGSAANTATMDFHTDAGLMIAMTTGYYSGRPASESSGLYIQMPTGVKAKAVADDDALIVMVGEGGARWLSPVLGAPLRAVPHALIADLSSGASRSWFGKMYLPPADAVVPQEKMSYEQYRAAQSNALATKDYSAILPSACEGEFVSFSGSGEAQPVYGRQLVEGTPCTMDDGTGTGINCWTICMSIVGLPCGTNAECVNPAGYITDPTEHCTSCKPSCTWNTTTEPFDGYCYGTGVTMYMQGFMSIVSSEKGSTACVNLLFQEFTLDNSVKFGFACVGVLLLGLFVQYLTKVRFEMSKRKTTLESNVALVLIHAVQVTLGYFLMLVAMTYSIELFVMVCLGLSIGFALFNLKTPPSANTDPCCPPDVESEEAGGLETPFIKNAVSLGAPK